jgi:hypothetical protein
VACALADLVRDILRHMLAVQALSEMEQGAAGVPVSDGSVHASACLGLGCDCVCAGDHGCLVSVARRCLESLDRSLRTMDTALAPGRTALHNRRRFGKRLRLAPNMDDLSGAAGTPRSSGRIAL